MSVIVVIGPSKSGTSATAGVLAKLGVDMGRDLRKPDHRNPRGYFEDRRFLELNSRILRAAGGSAWEPPPPDRISEVQPMFADEIAELVRTRTEEAGPGHRVWGWKTTTTTLIVGQFLPFLEKPKIVLVLRDPVAVARSADEHTAGIYPFDHLLAVQADYLKAAATCLESLERHSYHTLAYSLLTSDPDRAVADLIRFSEIDPTTSQVRGAIKHIASPRRIRLAKANGLAARRLRAVMRKTRASKLVKGR